MPELKSTTRPSSTVEKERTDFIEKIARGLVATGISSKAMAWAALGWRDDVGHEMPLDAGDWRRCVDTYVVAPPHLRKRMEPIMAHYHERLMAWTEKYGGGEWRLRAVEWPLPSTAARGSSDHEPTSRKQT